jgi:hypothetical protein
MQTHASFNYARLRLRSPARWATFASRLRRSERRDLRLECKRIHPSTTHFSSQKNLNQALRSDKAMEVYPALANAGWYSTKTQDLSFLLGRWRERGLIHGTRDDEALGDSENSPPLTMTTGLNEKMLEILAFSAILTIFYNSLHEKSGRA